MFSRIPAVLIAFVSVASAINEFIVPPPAPSDGNPTAIVSTYSVGDTINFSWETDWNLTTLTMWQNGNGTFSYLPNSPWLTAKTFTWTIVVDGSGGNPTFNLSSNYTFWFALFESNTQNYVGTQFVNIVQKDASSSATSSSASSTASSSSTTTPSLSSSTTSSSSTPTSGNQQTSQTPLTAQQTGLSSTAKVGLGVGLGVGFSALAVGFLAGLLFYRRKRVSAAEGQPMIEKPRSELESYQVPVEADIAKPAGPRHHLYEM